jgi:hypothetical protein
MKNLLLLLSGMIAIDQIVNINKKPEHQSDEILLALSVIALSGFLINEVQKSRKRRKLFYKNQ